MSISLNAKRMYNGMKLAQDSFTTEGVDPRWLRKCINETVNNPTERLLPEQDDVQKLIMIGRMAGVPGLSHIKASNKLMFN